MRNICDQHVYYSTPDEADRWQMFKLERATSEKYSKVPLIWESLKENSMEFFFRIYLITGTRLIKWYVDVTSMLPLKSSM